MEFIIFILKFCHEIPAPKKQALINIRHKGRINSISVLAAVLKKEYLKKQALLNIPHRVRINSI